MTVAAHAPLLAQDIAVHRGGRPVVQGLSLQLRAGECVAVVGPNGAGKSSLLAALAGLLPLHAGRVMLQGQPLDARPARDRAQRLAWLAQQGQSDGELPAREIVRLGRLPQQGLFGAPSPHDEAAVDRALHAVDAVALQDRRLSALSGGERQRVLLARALAVESPVLLLDEPTAHLDPPHQRALLRSLAARARDGAAVVLVVHDLTLALAVDRLLVMEAGRLVADGPPGDAGMRAELERVFDHAVRLEALDLPEGTRWVAVPVP